MNGQYADSTDPATWTDFETVLAAYQNGNGFDGISFALGKEYAGIDWDDCILESGEIAPKALEEIEKIDSYTELSPGGKGFKTLVSGQLPKGGHHNKFKDIELGVFNDSRYFCITGNIFPGPSHLIEDRQTQLNDSEVGWAEALKEALKRRHLPDPQGETVTILSPENEEDAEHADSSGQPPDA